MKRYQRFLQWLNQNQHPAEKQSPLLAAAGVALVSFILLGVLEYRSVSALRVWWAELAAYACVPVMLAFITLYRSAWHRHTAATGRALLAAGCSLMIFVGMLLALGCSLVLACLLLFAYGGLSRFHY